MAETPSLVSPDVHKKLSTPVEKFYTANYPYLVHTPNGAELIKKHSKERAEIDTRHIEEKQKAQVLTKEQLPTVRELKLTDIRSPAGLAHYINQSNDRWMQALEQKIGLDSTWKILALTGAKTTVTILESFTDILKFGEGTIKWVATLNKEDLSKWEKARAIANGIGIDGLRALAIAGPVLSKLWQTLENISISDNLFWYKSGNTFYQRWAVGDLSMRKNIEGKSPQWFHYSEEPLGLTKLDVMERAPKAFKELLDKEVTKIHNSKINFEAELKNINLSSRESMKSSASEYANRWIQDMLWNINNLVHYLEKYDQVRLWTRKLTYGRELYNNGLVELENRISYMEQTKGFILSPSNQILLREIIQRTETIIQP